MDKQYIIEQLIDKGVFKKGKRQLWELKVPELMLLLKKVELQNTEDT
ncbi:Fur-regulated basic protein FbpA [Bacillus toyonensis]|nr:Fur-regulated basic protein FbpA [Bacillus toyonensis]PEE20765.1 Fur-regulated basic protein FbpA [Bacillus toyonensis]